MTQEEERWFTRLRKVLRDMPDTVELQVHHNTIQMNAIGARSAVADQVGDADNVESLDYFTTKRVYPCSESL